MIHRREIWTLRRKVVNYNLYKSVTLLTNWWHFYPSELIVMNTELKLSWYDIPCHGLYKGFFFLVWFVYILSSRLISKSTLAEATKSKQLCDQEEFGISMNITGQSLMTSCLRKHRCLCSLQKSFSLSTLANKSFIEQQTNKLLSDESSIQSTVKDRHWYHDPISRNITTYD